MLSVSRFFISVYVFRFDFLKTGVADLQLHGDDVYFTLESAAQDGGQHREGPGFKVICAQPYQIIIFWSNVVSNLSNKLLASSPDFVFCYQFYSFIIMLLLGYKGWVIQTESYGIKENSQCYIYLIYPLVFATLVVALML